MYCSIVYDMMWWTSRGDSLKTHGLIDLIQLFDVNTCGWIRMLFKQFKNLENEGDQNNRVLLK